MRQYTVNIIFSRGMYDVIEGGDKLFVLYVCFCFDDPVNSKVTGSRY